MEDNLASARVKWQANRSRETGPSGGGGANRWMSEDKTREGRTLKNLQPEGLQTLDSGFSSELFAQKITTNIKHIKYVFTPFKHPNVEKLHLYHIKLDFSKLLHLPVTKVVWNGCDFSHNNISNNNNGR